MIQIAMIAVSIGLVVLGIKGFTASGIPISHHTTLTGKSGKIAGVACLVGGVLFIPVVFLLIWAYSNFLRS
ncbi:MAG TPA: hypothetical protein VGJ26_06725 [Pirellulales bacterium]|jgi:hypothetical protein